MSMYTYKAKDRAGKVVEGQFEVNSQREAVLKLKSLKLSPVHLSEKDGGGRQKAELKRKKITKRDILHLTNQLSSLLTAKLPLAKSLNTLINQATNLEMKEMLQSIFDMVKEGKPLSDALSSYPQHFSGLFRSMVSAGEVGGMLDESLTMVAETLEKDEALKSKLKKALTYPAMMFLVMVASIIVLITFVVPRFSGVFAGMGGSLPFPTKVLVGLSGFFQSYWIVMLVALGAGYFALRKYLSTKEGRLAFDKLLLRLPLAGGVVRDIALSRFALTFGALLGSGVSMIDTLEATKDVAGNEHIKQILAGVQQEVREGGVLSQSLAGHGDIFPPLMLGMIGTGEETGNLAEMTKSVGNYFMQESDENIETLTSLLEPIIIVVMGVMVGMVIMGMLLPIFEMSTTVK